MIKNLFVLDASVIHLNQSLVFIMLLGFMTHFLPQNFIESMKKKYVSLPAFMQACVILIFTTLIYIASTAKAVPFIYFQF